MSDPVKPRAAHELAQEIIAELEASISMQESYGIDCDGTKDLLRRFRQCHPAQIEPVVLAAPTVSAEAGWTCFHCRETFLTERAARQHFGMTDQVLPRCKTLMWLLREAEARSAATPAAPPASKEPPTQDEHGNQEKCQWPVGDCACYPGQVAAEIAASKEPPAAPQAGAGLTADMAQDWLDTIELAVRQGDADEDEPSPLIDALRLIANGHPRFVEAQAVSKEPPAVDAGFDKWWASKADDDSIPHDPEYAARRAWEAALTKGPA